MLKLRKMQALPVTMSSSPRCPSLLRTLPCSPNAPFRSLTGQRARAIAPLPPPFRSNTANPSQTSPVPPSLAWESTLPSPCSPSGGMPMTKDAERRQRQRRTSLRISCRSAPSRVVPACFWDKSHLTRFSKGSESFALPGRTVPACCWGPPRDLLVATPSAGTAVASGFRRAAVATAAAAAAADSSGVESGGLVSPLTASRPSSEGLEKGSVAGTVARKPTRRRRKKLSQPIRDDDDDNDDTSDAARGKLLQQQQEATAGLAPPPTAQSAPPGRRPRQSNASAAANRWVSAASAASGSSPLSSIAREDDERSCSGGVVGERGGEGQENKRGSLAAASSSRDSGSSKSGRTSSSSRSGSGGGGNSGGGREGSGGSGGVGVVSIGGTTPPDVLSNIDTRNKWRHAGMDSVLEDDAGEDEGIDEEEREEEEEQEGRDEEFDVEMLLEAKRTVAALIRAGDSVEEEIVRLGAEGKLSGALLHVIHNRFVFAQQEGEREVAQCMDLLHRRIQAEMETQQATPAMRLLNDLLHLRDSSSVAARHDEWLREAEDAMRAAFVPESDPFAFIAPADFDPRNPDAQWSPMSSPSTRDDNVLLRIDFIREVDELLEEVESTFLPLVEGLASSMDAESVAVRLQVEERLRTIAQVRELRDLAAGLRI